MGQHALLTWACELIALVALGLSPEPCAADAADIRRAMTFYASFDEKVEGDRGGGGLKLSTRFNDPKEKGRFVFEDGFDNKVFRIAPRKGVHGGALEVVDVLPRNGRIFFPA